MVLRMIFGYQACRQTQSGRHREWGTVAWWISPAMVASCWGYWTKWVEWSCWNLQWQSLSRGKDSIMKMGCVVHTHGYGTVGKKWFIRVRHVDSLNRHNMDQAFWLGFRISTGIQIVTKRIFGNILNSSKPSKDPFCCDLDFCSHSKMHLITIESTELYHTLLGVI